MIRDRYGLEVKEGDIVQVSLASRILYAKVVGTKDGGMIVAADAKAAQGQPTSMTADQLSVQVEIPFIERPGTNHPDLLRCINPETEYVLPLKVKEIS